MSGVEARLARIDEELCDQKALRNPRRLRELASERAGLVRIADALQLLVQTQEELSEMEEARSSGDPDLVQIAEEETPGLLEKHDSLERELRVLLLPRDPNDDRDVIVEIRSGTGGEEASLFVADVFRMYSGYASRKGWQVEVLNNRESERGGFKEIVFSVRGEGAYSRLKYEAGVHRVQRVPETEASGRIHTSACTVAVLPEADEVEVDLRPEDLRIDVYRATGPGGQSVNTTDSAV
ncbi:PCRF domain-containing protein, partial [Candidatus Fermentibacterales bacterium]|nr:PCRF domain-containing protein [Candidatus Fermentibacterales bacterium]